MAHKEPDARRVLELLRDTAAPPRDVAAKVGASPEAVDEARCLLDEMASAESDAILAMPPVLARALLRAAVQAGRHEVLLEAAQADREMQREARRIAHALEQQGVKVELPAKEQPAPQRPVETAAPQDPPVFLSFLDPTGERAVFWSRGHPGRGVELTQLLVGEKGVAEMVSGEMSRRRFRELARELPRSGNIAIVEVPREVARIVIDRARVAGKDSRAVPPEFPPWAAHALGPVPDEAPAPLRATGEGRPPPEELPALARRSAELLKEPELSRWIPDDEDVLRTCALAVEEAGRSVLYLEGEAGQAQRLEAVRAAVDRAVETYFEPRRASWAVRLLDVAWMLERTGRTEPARIAAAAAQTLAAGAPLSAVPLCHELFARIFLRAPPEKAPERASGLIVDPAGGAGGLIVPE